MAGYKPKYGTESMQPFIMLSRWRTRQRVRESFHDLHVNQARHNDGLSIINNMSHLGIPMSILFFNNGYNLPFRYFNCSFTDFIKKTALIKWLNEKPKRNLLKKSSVMLFMNHNLLTNVLLRPFLHRVWNDWKNVFFIIYTSIISLKERWISTFPRLIPTTNMLILKNY